MTWKLSMNSRVLLALFTALLGAGNCYGTQDRTNSLSEMQKALESESSARVYYDGANACLDEVDPLRFPHLDVQMPSNRSNVGIRDYFQNQISISNSSGVTRVTIGHIQRYILDEALQNIHLTAEEQYNPNDAIDAIVNSATIRLWMEAHHVDEPAMYVNEAIVSPDKSLPHLPKMINGLTVDKALDLVASTFGGFVSYGSCSSPRLLVVYFTPLHVGSRPRNPLSEEGRHRS
jgi:hypothetical protein